MEKKAYQNMLDYAFRLVAKKRYTIHQILEKLQKFNKKQDEQASESVITQVINRLKELDYLNDTKYTADYISQRIKLAPRGHFLLARELAQKGIPKQLIEQQFKQDIFDEFTAGQELLERKRPKWQKDPLFKQKQKAYRFLASKGFRQDAIYRIVKSCYNLHQNG